MSVGLRMTEEQVAAILKRAGYRMAEPRKVRPMAEAEKLERAKAAKPTPAKAPDRLTKPITKPKVRNTEYIDRLTAEIRGMGHEPEREFRFHPSRQWRLDLAIHLDVAGGVGIELDGVWSSGAHTFPTNAERDRRKDAHALARGWLVVRVTPAMIKDGLAARAVADAIRMRRPT